MKFLSGAISKKKIKKVKDLKFRTFMGFFLNIMAVKGLKNMFFVVVVVFAATTIVLIVVQI